MTEPTITITYDDKDRDEQARRLALLEAALAYGARGWAVHPTQGKVPRLDDWTNVASSNEKIIRTWWKQWPADNIGLVTGSRSGLVVLDVDVDPEKAIDGEATLAGLVARYEPLPITAEARTGRGGRHLYFKHPGHLVKTQAGALGLGLDIRGDGGQVIAPPSLHPNGTTYAWIEGRSPDEVGQADLPAWIESGSATEPTTPDHPSDSVLARLLNDPPQEGQRHDWLTRVAGSYASSTHDFSQYTAQVKVANASTPSPLPDREVEGIVKGIWAKEEAKVDEPAPWESPLPFETFDAPPFPVTALPKVLREFVLAEAEATQTPPDLAAMLVLSAVAATVAGRIEIEAREGWIEPLNVFTVTALAPGNRKTAVTREVIAPLLKLERDLIEELKPQIIQKRSEHRKLTKRLNHLHNELAKCKEEDEAKEITLEIAGLEIELERCVVPAEPQLITDDATPEKLGVLLRDQDGRIALMSGEASVFGQLAGRYSGSGPRVELYLAGHAGDDLRVDRVGRDPVHVENPALTIGVAVQPAVLEGLADVPILRERGVLARFLFSLPVSPLGSRRSITEPLSGNVRSRYAVMLECLLTHARGMHIDGVPFRRALHFDAEAQALFTAFQDEVEPLLGEFGELSEIAGWGGKLVGAAARIAGLLHVAAHPDRPDTDPVTAETLSGALEIGRYAFAHAKAAFVVMGADGAVADARHILRWIERHEKTEFSERDAYRTMTTRFKHPADLHPGLTALENRGYLRRVPEPKGKGPGRKPSPRWEVNPALRSRN